jgi:hypothetical protein
VKSDEWSMPDVAILRELWGTKSSGEIALALQVYRRPGSVNEKARKLGLPNMGRQFLNPSGGPRSAHARGGAAELHHAKASFWSPEDIRTLRALWGTTTPAEILKRLEHPRSILAITEKARSLCLTVASAPPRGSAVALVAVDFRPVEARDTWAPPPVILGPPTVFGPVHECQWPMWGMVPPPRPALFCGEAVSAGVYCPAHRAAAYAPRRERGT